MRSEVKVIRWRVLLVLALGFMLVAVIWSCSKQSGTQQATANQELYTCPMHPQVVQDHPGDCPICGMKLVKKMTSSTADKATDSIAALVNLSPSQEILAAVKTQAIGEREFRPSWEASGTIKVIEGRQVKVATKAMGRVDKLYVNFTGANVRKGQLLYDLYSPDLLAALQEARFAAGTMDPALKNTLTQASQDKLLSLGLSEEQIIELLSRDDLPSQITFYAPSSGVVMDKMATEGEWVMPGMTLFEIADLTQVWAEGVLYEKKLNQAHLNDEVTLTSEAYPDKIFHGTISWLAPMLDMMTRTLSFRVTLPNPGNELKPGMFVKIHVEDRTTFYTLAVPASAVLHTGRMMMVWVKVGEGRYNPREVQLGERIGDFYPVLAGLSVGEEVVIEGGYLIDSDSQIRSMGGAGHQHGGETATPATTPLKDSPLPHQEHPDKDMPEPGKRHGVLPDSIKAQHDIYICPMDPEVVSDQPGKCPKCGMNLVLKDRE